jgi:hypothetical protein
MGTDREFSLHGVPTLPIRSEKREDATADLEKAKEVSCSGVSPSVYASMQCTLLVSVHVGFGPSRFYYSWGTLSPQFSK